MNTKDSPIVSHFHCWQQVIRIGRTGTPACGQPLENHKQCCLCDLLYPPNQDEKKEECNFENSWKFHCKNCVNSNPSNEGIMHNIFCLDEECFCHKLIPPTKEGDWEEDIDKIGNFHDKKCYCLYNMESKSFEVVDEGCKYQKLKKLFRQTLLSHQNTWKREIEDLKIPQGMIEHWDETNSRDDAVQKGELIGFNKALDAVLLLINSKK